LKLISVCLLCDLTAEGQLINGDDNYFRVNVCCIYTEMVTFYRPLLTLEMGPGFKQKKQIF